jgi:hypothetical protein
VVSDTVRVAREELRSSVQADQRQLIPIVIGRVVAQARRTSFRVSDWLAAPFRNPHSAIRISPVECLLPNSELIL